METKYKQDAKGNLILPQSEWPTLTPEELNLRQLLDKVNEAQSILDYSTLAERDAATSRWSAAQRAYNSELQRIASKH